MAILTGINTRLHKSAGDWTFQRTQNTTIAMQKVEKKATPVRSRKQMLRRVGWANIVAMWGSFTGNLRPSFEKKNTRHSDFNAFMAANLGDNNVYLTRSQVRFGVCVVAPYMVSSGTLAPIATTAVSGGKMKSDIALGSLTIGADTTVGDFSKAVLDNNQDFLDGDQITCFIAQQVTVGNSNLPKVRMIASRVMLDRKSTTKLLSIVDGEGFAVIDGCLASKSVVEGGIAWIHSRIENGKTKVSPQYLVVNNNLLSSYTDSAACSAAIESYGGVNKQDYLTPDANDEETVTVQPNP